MTGWLVVNGFTNTEKFNTLFEMFECAAESKGIGLQRVRTTKLWYELGRCGNNVNKLYSNISCSMEADKKMWSEGKPDFIIFWDKDVRLARLLEEGDVRVFNSASAIALCDDKAETYLALRDVVRQPKTFISAKQFRTCDNYDYYIKAADDIGYPVIVKECLGSFGAQVYKADDEEGLKAVIESIGERAFIIQEYIKSEYKNHNDNNSLMSDNANGQEFNHKNGGGKNTSRDVRLQMVGKKCVAAMLRTNPDDFRANITNGGSMSVFEPTKSQVEMALKVMEALKLDFAGIDILFDENDEPVFCEANSNAHFKNLYDCTGINTAEYILEHLLESAIT